jgi:excisionase family DNA binding protein
MNPTATPALDRPDTPVAVKPLLVSKLRAAAMIDASVDYIETLIRQGLVRAVKTGRTTRVRFDDVEALLHRLPQVQYRQRGATS